MNIFLLNFISSLDFIKFFKKNLKLLKIIFENALKGLIIKYTKYSDLMY